MQLDYTVETKNDIQTAISSLQDKLKVEKFGVL